MLTLNTFPSSSKKVLIFKLYTYLYRLRYVHLVYLNMRKTSTWGIVVILFIVIKEVGGIHTNADCSLVWGKSLDR